MRFTILTICLLCLYEGITAQHFKFGLQQGIGLDPIRNNDSIFFAKNYNYTQARIGYQYGKLGIISHTSIIGQKSVKSLELDQRKPDDFSAVITEDTLTDVNSINTTLGLELCLPVAKKINFNIYTTYGISISSSDFMAIAFNGSTRYRAAATGNVSGCSKSGLALNYKFNKHFALRWQNEYQAYKINYDGLDTRKTPTTFNANQAKKLIITSLGLQYTI